MRIFYFLYKNRSTAYIKTDIILSPHSPSSSLPQQMRKVSVGFSVENGTPTSNQGKTCNGILPYDPGNVCNWVH